MKGYALRYLPSDPYGRAGHTSTSTFATTEEANELRRACPNAEHMEVVPVDGSDRLTLGGRPRSKEGKP